MITWADSLATGHENVDSEHKQLIRSLNDLDAAMKQGVGREQITQMVTFLDNYVAGHFAREEAYMKKVNCPSLSENCKAHAELTGKLSKWKDQLAKGASTSLILDIYRETSAWITNHIIKVDCKLRGCKVVH